MRRATRFLVPTGLVLLVVALAGRELLPSRGQDRAPTSPRPPAPEVSAGSDRATEAAVGRSDRERLLAWTARHKGLVSFDPVEWFLEDTRDERTWHDDPEDTPEGEITAVALLTEDLERALAELPGGVAIQVLELPNDKLTPAGAARLLGIRGLRVLHLSQAVTDAVVAVLGDLSELEWLLIDGESLTDESLAHLGRLSKLRHLSVIPAGFRGDSGASSCLPANLEIIFISTMHGPGVRGGLDDRFVTALPPLPNLVELDLAETGITDVALARIGTFHGLRKLGLRNLGVTDRAASHLATLQKLERLDLSSSSITDQGFAAISKLRSLRDLGLRGTDVRTLPGAEALTELRTLDLQSSAIDDEGLRCLAPLGQLEWLHLSDTKTTDAGLAHVGALSGLRGLSLGETNITSAGLAHLQGLANLEELRLRRTSVNDDGMRALAGLRSLRTLDVDETGVTPDGLLALKALPNLRHVGLRCGPAERERLKAAMPECSFSD